MSLSYWQRFQEAFCKRSRRREVALMAENVHLTQVVTELTAENEALHKHNEIMKDSLAAAQAEVERLIQVAEQAKLPARSRPRRPKGGE